MKSTKKIIIGLIAVIALLITIAGALAADPTATYSPNNTAVTILNNQSQVFSVAVSNPDMMALSYEWYVDGVSTGAPVENSSDYTSSFTFSSTSVGTHVVSVVVEGGLTPSLHQWTVTVEEAQPASLLSITSVKVNGKSSGKLSLSDVNKIKVEVKNDHTEDIDEIVVTVRILDVDGEDLDEESDEFDLSDGKEHEETLEFDLSNEDVDEEEYTIEVEVEGEDNDGNDYSDVETLTVEVDREKDDLIITKAELEDSQVFCSANSQTTLKVKIKNIGENEQEGAKVTVKNAELDLNLQKANIDLDDYAGSDNDYEATFALNLEGTKQGTYTLDVAVYSEDDDLMDSEEVELQVVCAAETASQEETTSTEHYADKELAAELQKKIDEYKVLQESQAAAAKGEFRESNTYVLLLGVMVAMMFFAAALSATYLLVKKK